MESRDALLTVSCRAGLGADDRLTPDEQAQVAAWFSDWQVNDSGMERTFSFANYHGTMAFVNAVADVAHAQDHHPDLQVSYSRCTVAFSTHSAGGLTWNDAVCAARCDAAFDA